MKLAGLGLALAALLVLTGGLLVLTGGMIATPARAQALPDVQALANRQFVQAMDAIHKADQSYDLIDQTKQLQTADRLLSGIITQMPESSLAVQLSTNQFIGDFDYNEFKSRIRGLACNDPQTSLCFLSRVEGMLQPVDYPIVTPRWDWLSLAIADYQLGDKDRTHQIIAPFLAALRRAPRSDDQARDLFLGRALALTGEGDLALDITRHLPDCATRIYNLTDISQAYLWKGDKDKGAKLAEEAADYAQTNNCAWEQGLVAEGLFRAGLDAKARTLFLNTVEEQFSRFKERKGNCCPPELAVAAGDLGDPNLALGLLRTVQQDSPWTVPAVLGRLGLRGEMQLATTYTEQVQDPALKAETFVQLAAAALKAGDRKQAEALEARVDKLAAQNPKAPVLVQKARGDHLLYKDQRWRSTFLAALGAADHDGNNDQQSDTAVTLLAALVEIETGVPMLQ